MSDEYSEDILVEEEIDQWGFELPWKPDNDEGAVLELESEASARFYAQIIPEGRVVRRSFIVTTWVEVE
jgi:hypothetical protein